eukprot:16434938-Heterocapsa_arctica.AAC.1
MSPTRAEDRRLLGLIEKPLGLDKSFDIAGDLRNLTICVVGDSGTICYCSKTARHLNGLLCEPAESIKNPWRNASITSGSGWSAEKFYDPVDTFIKKNIHLMTPAGPGGIRKFPASVVCVIFDNLNACFQEKGQVEGNVKGDRWVRLRA